MYRLPTEHIGATIADDRPDFSTLDAYVTEKLRNGHTPHGAFRFACDAFPSFTVETVAERIAAAIVVDLVPAPMERSRIDADNWSSDQWS